MTHFNAMTLTQEDHRENNQEKYSENNRLSDFDDFKPAWKALQ